MPKRSLEFCALHFLNQWLGKEAEFYKNVRSAERPRQLAALKSAGAHFRVARNLRKRYDVDSGIARYAPVLDILNDTADLSSENVISRVETTAQRISAVYGNRGSLSVTSKFLWLKYRAPVRIYDSQARKALGTADGD